MPTLFCCILNCESESINCKKRKIFYRLPQNSDRKQLWLNQVGERIKYGTVSSNSRICNSHFATGKPNLDSSHVDYMPTIFPWSTKEEKLRSYKSVEEYESKIKELEQKILAKAFLNASSGTKVSQESSTTRFDLPETDICSKLIIDTDPQQQSQLQSEPKIRLQKSGLAKNNSTLETNGSTLKPINPTDKSQSSDCGKVPIFKESFVPCHVASQQSLQSNLNSQSTIQLVPDNNNSVSIKSNLLNYLLSSIARVNMANNNTDLSKSLSVNVSMPTGPLNLSQTFNKLDDQSMKFEKINESDASKKEQLKRELINQPIEPSLDVSINLCQSKNSLTKSQTPDRIGTPNEEATSRSCTCTKSSCLKLYCECFANGNLCCSGCTCINCRNNDNYKEERAKIVSSYLERDPWVFNSKIENKEVGKKHSKGCNCLKSSCLKNYCECFENKVFCSNLCRCRMCYNNEEHTQHNNKDEAKIYASSHTSESLSVMSENSPRNINRKRKKSSVKANDIYEDVSSNNILQESDDEVNAKRCQLDSEATSVENDKRSSRSINSMEIPPVLPQEDDFTEEELALMVKFREQRTEKPFNVKTECVSPPEPTTQSLSSTFTPGITSNAPIITSTTASPLINIPAHLDSNLLLTLSKSLAVANLGLNGLNVVNTTLHENKRPTGIDLLGLLATQQLMVSRPPPPPNEVQNLNCISVPQNCNHVIPVNLTQIPSSCMAQITQVPSTSATQSRVITTSPTSVTGALSQSKPKLSTEDYVRKHIEAAERAVRADYMRKDSSNYKKPITKQKIKIDPFPLTPKPPHSVNNLKSQVVTNIVSSSDASRHLVSQPPILNKQLIEDSNSAISSILPHIANGSVDPSIATISPISVDVNLHVPNLPLYNWPSMSTASAAASLSTATSAPILTQNPPSVLHTVQMNCQSSTLSENVQVKKPLLTTDTHCTKDKHVSRGGGGRMKSLRQSFQSLRSEIRSLKFHMRADQSRLRRLERNLHQLRNQIGK